jgi:diaminohydroxyphosphoribosylaminopyrimidine deaminase/5-amino-6-(5-phosphoribosylamino)uracil reductase
MSDPNPAVAGDGFARLRKAGMEVIIGPGEQAARRLNEDFAVWIAAKRPFMTLKCALTLDGKIAAKPGVLTRITSGASLDEAQRMRHAADAIVTGIGTVLVDDPLLTDRTGLPRRRKLLRVILDSRLRLPLTSKIVQSAQDDLLVVTTSSAPASRARRLRHAGVEVIELPAKNRRVDLLAVIKELADRQMLHVLLEGGAELNGAALQAGVVDKMFLFYAAKIMGADGVSFAEISSRNFSKAPPLRNLTLHRFGEDFAVEGYFRDVYGDHRARRKN